MENNQKELVLLEDLGINYSSYLKKYKRHFGLFKCFCGNEFKSQISNVQNRNTKSCGCLRNIHNLRSHRLYHTWRNMIDRCYNPKNKRYVDWGGRGIRVCNEWIGTPKNFIDDMYPTFVEGLTLDRINVNGNYELSNCRWVSNEIQTRNTRLLTKANTSGYRGISWHTKSKRWISRIMVDRKSIHLGYFNDALDGAKAYDKYVIDNSLEHTLNGVLPVS